MRHLFEEMNGASDFLMVNSLQRRRVACACHRDSLIENRFILQRCLFYLFDTHRDGRFSWLMSTRRLRKSTISFLVLFTFCFVLFLFIFSLFGGQVDFDVDSS